MFLEKLFPKNNLKRYEKKADRIEKLSVLYEKMSDDELKHQTIKLKERLKKESLDDLLEDAYAVIREAAWRVIQEKPYRVQLIGGIALHYGDAAEMKTGEGKTLTAILPVYLNALSGKGVHVITVNEYLAQRDAKWMGEIYRFMGLTVGCNLQSMSSSEKRAAYQCDITYTTNSELGFDYLRDNMVMRLEDKVQRGLHFALIDEVDSVLIDESRTPLIISGWGTRQDGLYLRADHFAKSLTSDEYSINKDEQSVELTVKGMEHAERFFQIKHLYMPGNETLTHFIKNALKANYIMRKDVDYVIDEEGLSLIDQFTGRKMPSREYSDGLHQAIQAKEMIEIKQESQTLATITYQNFFRLYEKLSGMSGTVKTEEDEFLRVYNMRVMKIPTHRPVQRIDYPDEVFPSKKEKIEALLKEIEELHQKRQPVLVGTISVENSEMLSELLKKKGIRHEVLNARNHALEAAIVAKAGIAGAVTIATNMAGRGTDIKLTDESRQLGGLAVLGLERHEAKRIDDQLRGRSGRQGDPGFSRFYVSVQDDLCRKHATEFHRELMDEFTKGKLKKERMRTLVNSIQSNAEYMHAQVRAQVLEYDTILMEQRKVIYEQRDLILSMDSVISVIELMMERHIETVMEQCKGFEHTKRYAKQLSKYLITYHVTEAEIEEIVSSSKEGHLAKDVSALIMMKYQKSVSDVEEIARRTEKRVLLSVLDRLWRNHTDFMDKLKQGIGYRSYANIKPADAYRDDGYEQFDKMIERLQFEVTSIIVNTHYEIRT